MAEGSGFDEKAMFTNCEQKYKLRDSMLTSPSLFRLQTQPWTRKRDHVCVSQML